MIDDPRLSSNCFCNTTKKLPEIIQVLLRYLGTDKQVRYWCEDESRLRLKTMTGRTITLKGVKPEGIVGWQRKNFYLYGLVEPATGYSFFFGVFSPNTSWLRLKQY